VDRGISYASISRDVKIISNINISLLLSDNTLTDFTIQKKGNNVTDTERRRSLRIITKTRQWRGAIKVSGGLNCFRFKAIHTVILVFHHHHQWLYSPLLGPRLFLNFIIFFTKMAGLLG
jgi:hypothetical protein